MNKLRKIHNLLSSLESNIFDKLQEQANIRLNAEENANRSKIFDDLDYAKRLAESHEHTKGQLFELTYILEKFWEIIIEDENE